MIDIRSRLSRFFLCAVTLTMQLTSCIASDTIHSVLYPVRENNLWGFIDERGEMLIPAKFQDVTSFFGNYSIVHLGNESWGIIDKDGIIILETDRMIECLEGCRAFAVYGKDSLEDADQCGIFDTETGVFSGYKWKKVELVKGADLLPVQGYNGLWGFAESRSGYECIACNYHSVSAFQEGWAGITLTSISNPYTYDALINETGKLLFPPSGLWISDQNGVSSGLIQVIDADTGLTGYMDMRGQLVLNPKWDYGSKFYGNYAWVQDYDSDALFYIDRNGNTLDRSILPIGTVLDDYDACEFFNGVSCVTVEYGEAEHIGIMTEEGDLLFVLEEPTTNISLIFPFYDFNVAWYMAYQGSYGLIDRDGYFLNNAVFICEEETGSPFINGLAAVREYGIGGKWGFIDRNGKWVIIPEWDYASSFIGELAYVEKNGKMAYINQQGKIIWEEE